MKKTVSYVIACALLGVSNPLLAAKVNFCGELKASYGPYNYIRDRASGKLEIVESAHFTTEVENGVRGTTGPIGGDLSYTLLSIPNHHRALATLSRLSITAKAVQLPSAKYPTECYFDRAMRYAPTDAMVRATYGNYLSALGRTADALNMFQTAADLEPDNPTINYNLGLLYVKTKKYDKAEEYADKAYAAGFPLPGLRNQLAQVRKGSGDSK
jgi:tetratricopeptide (TPR) repeat protein